MLITFSIIHVIDINLLFILPTYMSLKPAIWEEYYTLIMLVNLISVLLSNKCESHTMDDTCRGAFLWLKWAGLPPVILGPSILSKEVEIGPIATQFGLWLVRKLCLICQEHAYGGQNVVLILCFYRRSNFSPVSIAKGTFLQFLPHNWLFCYVAKLSTMQ